MSYLLRLPSENWHTKTERALARLDNPAEMQGLRARIAIDLSRQSRRREKRSHISTIVALDSEKGLSGREIAAKLNAPYESLLSQLSQLINAGIVEGGSDGKGKPLPYRLTIPKGRRVLAEIKACAGLARAREANQPQKSFSGGIDAHMLARLAEA